MAYSNHKLYLGMYSFQVKKKRKSETFLINDFLAETYPDVENKFRDGFAKEIIGIFDEKTFKNSNNTHGGTLEQKTITSEKRCFDIMIDGGLTGIEQFIVDEDGNKETISKDKVVGLKFYARIWLPAGGKTGYLFIQKYGGLTIKPLFDEIIYSILKLHEYVIVGGRKHLKPTTTKKRLKDFLKTSAIRDITVISKDSKHETGVGDARTATIKLKGFSVGSDLKIDKNVIKAAMKNHGFSFEKDRDYIFHATYESRVDGKKEEEKTTKLNITKDGTKILDASEDNINIVPNILLPSECIDAKGYPIFEKMKEYVNEEVEQIKKEVNK